MITTLPVRIAIGAPLPVTAGLRTGRVVPAAIRSIPSGGCDAANVATVTHHTQEVPVSLVTTQTMHDALTNRPITTIYVDALPSIHVIDQCDADPISLNLRSSNPFRITASGRMTFDATVAYWVRILSGNLTCLTSTMHGVTHAVAL